MDAQLALFLLKAEIAEPECTALLADRLHRLTAEAVGLLGLDLQCDLHVNAYPAVGTLDAVLNPFEIGFALLASPVDFKRYRRFCGERFDLRPRCGI